MDAVKHAHDWNLRLHPAACPVRHTARRLNEKLSIDYC
jgi:hypothetical protein